MEVDSPSARKIAAVSAPHSASAPTAMRRSTLSRTSQDQMDRGAVRVSNNEPAPTAIPALHLECGNVVRIHLRDHQGDVAGHAVSRGVREEGTPLLCHPLLDLARTKSILSVDPAVRALAPALREVVDEVARAWEEGYGSEASSIPAACHVWAGQVMLADLGPRYSEETLAPVRTWIKDWSDQLP